MTQLEELERSIAALLWDHAGVEWLVDAGEEHTNRLVPSRVFTRQPVSLNDDGTVVMQEQLVAECVMPADARLIGVLHALVPTVIAVLDAARGCADSAGNITGSQQGRNAYEIATAILNGAPTA